MSGKLVVMIGPSGVGKSAILHRLRQRHPQLHFPKSATTRARRQGEGEDNYHFLSEEEFDAYIADGKFLEYQTVHATARYGTLIDEIIPFIEKGRIVVRELEVQGFDALRADPRFGGPSPKYPLQSIFILPETMDQLVEHIRKRAPVSDEELKNRIHSMEHEMTYAEKCDARVLNREGQVEQAVAEVEKIMGLV